MKMFMFPMKTIEALPAEVKTYILLQIARHVEDELNENIGRSYKNYEIDAKYIAKILCAMEVEVAENAENANCGHSSGNT